MNVNIWFVNERIMLCLERCLCVAALGNELHKPAY